MRKYLLWGLMLISLVSAFRAWAGFDEGVRAYDSGDFATAFREWLPLAQHGDADVQRNLGLMYEKGEGVPQDYAQAVQWYRRAAEQGNANAQCFLGRMYNKGEGVPQDYAQAVQWYHRAAEQGNADAQNDLGLMYSAGQSVPQDNQQAYFWYNLAAAHFSHQGSREIAVQNRDSVAARLTPAQLAQAQAQARTWQPKPETPSTSSAPSLELSVPVTLPRPEALPQASPRRDLIRRVQKRLQAAGFNPPPDARPVSCPGAPPRVLRGTPSLTHALRGAVKVFLQDFRLLRKIVDEGGTTAVERIERDGLIIRGTILPTPKEETNPLER